MKTTKRKLEAFKKSLGDKFNREVGIRKSITDDVEITEENYSFSKYIRGAAIQDWTDADVEKAMFQKVYAQAVGTTGGFLVPDQTSLQIIELLKAAAVIRSMPGVRVIDMDSKWIINRQDSAVSTSWGTENTSMSEDTNAAWGEVSLELKKLKCLQKLSREMLANASPSMDTLIIKDMVEEIALAEDLAFLEGIGGDQPIGFYYHTKVKNTDLGATITFDDFTTADYQIELANSRITGWVGHPRTKNTLRTIQDGIGRRIYEQGRITDKGNLDMDTIGGIVAKWTTQIPKTNRPDSLETYMVGGDWSNLLIGNKPQIRIETTITGGAAFESDQIFLKVVREVDMALRHPETFVVVKGIKV